MALVDTQRPEEALPALEIAARAEPPQARTFYYLGRAQLGAGPAGRGRGLAAAGAGAGRAGRGRRRRSSGRSTTSSARRSGSSGDAQEAGDPLRRGRAAVGRGVGDLARGAGPLDGRRPGAGGRRGPGRADDRGLAARGAPAVASALELERRVTAALARTYLNLGVMQAQGERFARRRRAVREGRRGRPRLPAGPVVAGHRLLQRAAVRQGDRPARPRPRGEPERRGRQAHAGHGLAQHARAYEKAAELLRDDPELGTDPSLQFAYGLALVKSDRAAGGRGGLLEAARARTATRPS